MNPRERIELIKSISVKLQELYTTVEINTYLSGYGIKNLSKTVVTSKRLYAMEILKSEKESILYALAGDLEIPYSLSESKPITAKSSNKPTANAVDTQKRIFISHSSKDSKYVEQIIELLEGIGVPSNQIFCTSFEGYGIELGDDFLSVIKKELNKDVLVIFVLSPNFYSSPISLCEMGATWVKTTEHIPIIVPPFGYDQVKGVIPNSQGMKINEKLKVNSMKEKIENFLGITPKKMSAWERKRDNILKDINRLIEESSKKLVEVKEEIRETKKASSINKLPLVEKSSLRPSDIPSEILELIKEKAKMEWPDDFEMQLHVIELQSEAYKSLQDNPPNDISTEQFSSIRAKARREWPDDFEMQLHVENEQIKSFKRLSDL